MHKELRRPGVETQLIPKEDLRFSCSESHPPVYIGSMRTLGPYSPKWRSWC